MLCYVTLPVLNFYEADIAHLKHHEISFGQQVQCTILIMHDSRVNSSKAG